MLAAPTFQEIEQKFEALLNGSCSREEADSWAVQWVYAHDPPSMPPAAWTALSLLAKCDARQGPHEPYLYPDEQLRGWYEEFRARSQHRHMLAAPTFHEIGQKFEALLNGSCSREEADSWAVQWVYAHDPPEMPPAAWKALSLLAGCDLRHGPGEPYLHSDEQVREWLNEFRAQAKN